MAATVQILADIPMFALMDEAERSSLAELLATRKFDKGETIFNFGDAGDALYIIRNGSVQVFIENYQGDKIILRENLTGDVFGDISMLDGGPRTATAVATEDTECLVLDRDQLVALITKHPHAGLDLLTVMGGRLRATNELLRTQVSRNLNEVMEIETTPLQRIADIIAEFSGSMAFLILNGLWFLVWIAINVFHLGIPQFDPYPFGLLTMIVSLEAIFLSCFVLISQNRQSEKDHVKADIEYEVNLKAELEVAQLHGKVDRIYEEMQAHFAQLKKNTTGIMQK
jgi:CRP/FNR family transcriptional regulator, cyclic AMP receptor protein